MRAERDLALLREAARSGARAAAASALDAELLLHGEEVLTEGLAQSVDIATWTGKRGAGEGRLFATNARLIFWEDGADLPAFQIQRGDVDGFDIRTIAVPMMRSFRVHIAPDSDDDDEPAVAEFWVHQNFAERLSAVL